MVLSSTRVDFLSDFYQLITSRVVKDEDQVQISSATYCLNTEALHIANTSSCLPFDVAINK